MGALLDGLKPKSIAQLDRERREERRLAEAEAADIAEAKERQRQAEMSMWERIEECRDIHDVKALLHLWADRLGWE